jgi:hypothetical protein
MKPSASILPYLRPSGPAALAAGLVLFAILAFALFPYTLDDTYIYLRFARNAAAGRGLSFNPGEPVYGFTSPLWLALLVLAAKAGLDPLIAAKVTGIVLALLAVVVFARLAVRTIPHPGLAAAASFLWAGNAWLVRWSVTGMETALAVLLLLSGLLTLARPGRRRDAWAGGLFGALYLTRPETLVILPAGVIALRTMERRWREPLRFAASYAAIVAPWLFFAMWYFGSAVPNTAIAKSGLMLSPADALDRLRRIVMIVGAVAGFEGALIVAALASSLVVRRLSLPRLPLALATVLPLVYVATGAVIVSRYLLLVVPLVVLLGGASAASLARGRWAAGLAAALVVIGTLQNQWVLWRIVAPEARDFTRSLDTCFGGIGARLAEISPPDAVVAAGDIGLIGFRSDRRILDLEGLVTTPSLALRQRSSRETIVIERRYLEVGRPAYVVDGPASKPSRLPAYEEPPYATPIFNCAMNSLGITQPGEHHYTLYRLDYDR